MSNTNMPEVVPIAYKYFSSTNYDLLTSSIFGAKKLHKKEIVGY